MSTPDAQPVIDYLQQDRNNAVDRLSDFLSIASVSTDPAYASSVTEAAEWVARQLGEMGLSASVKPTDGHPVVVGTSDASEDGSDRPRVLFYGHYDVQPPDPVDQWSSPPFEPAIHGNKIVARGASDDKGQVACFMEALRAWHEVHGELPCDVTVLIEGEEECGSENLPRFVRDNAELLKADICVVSDTAMWATADGTYEPAICYALRGLLYFDLKLHGPDRDLHSGVYGGTIPNPATLLTRVLGDLFDDDHRVTIPGYYDDVLPLTDEEKANWDTLGFDEDSYLRSIGVEEPYGEAGYTTLERRWARPACDVNGIYGGYMSEGAKTVIPSYAGAKVSFRLAANQDPRKIAQAFREWLDAQPVHGLKWEITEHGQAEPVAVPTDSKWIDAAKTAIQRVAGQPPRLVREGATIPIVGTFKNELGLDTMLIGFGRHDDRIHSPNEKFDLTHFFLGCEIHAALLAEIAMADS